MPPRAASLFSRDDALGAIAQYGSERRAASALGVGRSTLHDIAHGRYEGGAKTSETIKALDEAVSGALRVVVGLVRSLGGGTAEGTMRASRELARNERRASGATQERALQFQRQMGSVGLQPNGRPLPPPGTSILPPPEPERDALGREIQPGQRENYRRLNDAYRAGTLTSDQYDRFREYQLGSGSGGTGVEIEDI